MTQNAFILILSMAIIIVVLGFIGLFVVTRNYMILKHRYDDLKEIAENLKEENKAMTVKYSDEILKYFRVFTTQISMIKFQEFLDSHDVKKITESNVKNLINDICKTVNESINRRKIVFDDALFTEGFLNQYIIQITITTVKDLVAKSVDAQNITI